MMKKLRAFVSIASPAADFRGCAPENSLEINHGDDKRTSRDLITRPSDLNVDNFMCCCG